MRWRWGAAIGWLAMGPSRFSRAGLATAGTGRRAGLDSPLDLPLVRRAQSQCRSFSALPYPSAASSPVEGRFADHPAGDDVYPWQM